MKVMAINTNTVHLCKTRKYKLHARNYKITPTQQTHANEALLAVDIEVRKEKMLSAFLSNAVFYAILLGMTCFKVITDGCLQHNHTQPATKLLG